MAYPAASAEGLKGSSIDKRLVASRNAKKKEISKNYTWSLSLEVERPEVRGQTSKHDVSL